jgi:hypothetical protein
MAKCNETHNFLIPKDKKPIKGAIFTAHPDDETIWMGGTILSRNDWIWKIFIATHNMNDERGIEFQKAINEYKVQSGIQQLSYDFIEIMEDTQEENNIVISKVKDKLNEIEFDGFDVIFTHNIDGEYNHINHKILGEYFKNKRKDGLNIWHFFCPAIQNPKKKQVGEYIESIFLNPAITAKKTSVFQCGYTSQHFLWTNFGDFMRFQFCSGVEMFTRY